MTGTLNDRIHCIPLYQIVLPLISMCVMKFAIYEVLLQSWAHFIRLLFTPLYFFLGSRQFNWLVDIFASVCIKQQCIAQALITIFKKKHQISVYYKHFGFSNIVAKAGSVFAHNLLTRIFSLNLLNSQATYCEDNLWCKSYEQKMCNYMIHALKLYQFV